MYKNGSYFCVKITINSEKSEQYHNTRSSIDGALPGPKTDRDPLMKDYLQSTGGLSQKPWI